ncbi:MAG: DnaB-like helicase C-terminal domain-containing protein [Pseudomonadota bacterium]
MRTSQALEYMGIHPKAYSQGSYSTKCPMCSHKRKGANKRKPCLSLKITDKSVAWLCHHCGFKTPRADEDKAFYQILFGDTPKKNTAAPAPQTRQASDSPPKQPARPTHTPSDAPTDLIKWFDEQRGIRADVLKIAKVSLANTWMPGDAKGATSKAIALPYMRGGKVVNVKYRTFDKRMKQVRDAESILYGLDGVPEGAKKLIITEGEIDALSFVEAGIMNVVSVPNGAPQQPVEDDDSPKFEYLTACKDFLRRFDTFILAVDGDDPGKILAEELARRLGKHKCRIVTWPTGQDAPCKDANETLLVHGPAGLQAAIDEAAPYPIKGLFGVGRFADKTRQVYRDGHDRAYSTGWARLDDLMKVVPGMLTVVTGTPGSGKSEFIDSLMMNLATSHDWRFAVASFENDPGEDHLPKLAQKYLAMPFWPGPTARMGDGDLETALAWLTDRFFFIAADDESPTIDWLIEKAEAAVAFYGIKGLVIDPYNEIEHRRPRNMNETEYISALIGKVKRFARNRGVHVWFIAHPQKMPRNKDGHRPAPSLYDISGSAHWANKADVGLIVHRTPGERETTIKIAKIRFSWFGQVGEQELVYDPVKGRFSEAA